MSKTTQKINNPQNVKEYEHFNSSEKIILEKEAKLKEAKERYERLKLEKERFIKQKHESVKGVLDTIINKPNFIKLLEYALHSIDSMLTPPNRDIRLNSKVIIEESGVEALKLVMNKNLENEDIVENVCIILSKLLGEPIDREIAKEFMDRAGHEIVFEMVCTKNPTLSSIYLIKIMNSLVSIPQLSQKLIDSGVIEALKLVNDLYADNSEFQEIIEINLDSIKKISNLKKGREILDKKNFLTSLLRTALKASEDKNENIVLSSMSIIDNITREENALKDLKSKKNLDIITKILDHMDNSEEILQLGAKIYSKVSSKEDFMNEVDKLVALTEEDLLDQSKLKEAEKSLVLVSNLMLIEDNMSYFKQNNNLLKLKELFKMIKSINLNDKNKDYKQTMNMVLKFLMKILGRLINILDSHELEDLADDDFLTAVLEALKSSCDGLLNSSNIEDIKNTENGVLFRDLFSSTCGVIEKVLNTNTKKNGKLLKNDIRNLNQTLKITKIAFPSFQTDEKFNLSASKIISLANKCRLEYEDDGIKEILKSTVPGELDKEIAFKDLHSEIFNLNDLFPFFKNVLNFTSNSETTENLIKTLISLFNESNNLKTNEYPFEKLIQFLPSMLNGLKSKYNNRSIVESIFKYLDFITSKSIFKPLYEKEKLNENSDLFNLELVTPIAIALTKHKFESLSQIKSISFSKNENSSKVVQDSKKKTESLQEERINLLGGKVLERLVDSNELKKQLKLLRDTISSFKPDNYSIENLLGLENSLVTFMAFLENKSLFKNCYDDVLREVTALIKKEVAFIEQFKKKDRKEEYDSVVTASTKRLLLSLGMVNKINEKCQIIYNDNKEELEEKNRILGGVKTTFDCYLDLFDKSTESKLLNSLLDKFKDDVGFMLEHASDLSTKNKEEKSVLNVFKAKKFDCQFEDNIIEKIIKSMINLWRKFPDDSDLCEKVIDLLNELVERDPDSSNSLVKNGCPKILISLLETNNKESLLKKALALMKKIGDSNPENLEMLSNQDLINKLFEINNNYGPGISEYSAPILSALMRLPQNEEKITSIVETTLNDFVNAAEDLENEPFFSKRSPILNDLLSKLNVFTCSDNHANLLLKRNDFKKAFSALINCTNHDSDLSKHKEPLLKNEVDLMKKMINICDKFIFDKEKEQELEQEKDNLIKLAISLTSNINFREALIGSLGMVQNYIKNTDDPIPFEKLKNEINESFVDKLFEINENYLGDTEIQNVVNNILCSVCFQSEDLSKYIIKKGGLKNVLNELKYLIKADSEAALESKYNHLRLLDSLMTDPENMSQFTKLNGCELVTSILRHEIKKSDDQIFKNKESIDISNSNNNVFNSYAVLEELSYQSNPEEQKACLSKFICLSKNNQTNLLGPEFIFGKHIPICFNISNQLISNGYSLGKNFLKWVVDLTSRSYSNINYFNSLIKILTSLINLDQKNLYDIPKSSSRALSQLLLSGLNEYTRVLHSTNYLSSNIPNSNEIITDEISEKISNCLHILSDEKELINIISVCDKITSQDKDIFNEEKVNLFLAFLTKAIINNFHKINDNKNKLKGNLVPALQIIYKFSEKLLVQPDSILNFVSIIGFILGGDFKEFFEEGFCRKILNLSSKYFVSENIGFVDSSIEGFIELLNKTRKRSSILLNPDYLDFMKNVYLRSFEIFENYANLLDPAVNKNYYTQGFQNELPYLMQVIEKLKNIACQYWRSDKDYEYKSSTLKRLTTACVNFINGNFPFEVKKTFWEMLYNVILNDKLNLIIENEEFALALIDLLKKQIQSYPNEEILRDLLQLLCDKVTSQDLVAENLLSLISNDITNYKDQIPENILSRDLKALSSLIDVAIVPRLIVKNKLLLEQLTHFYKDSKSGSSEDRMHISKILKALFCNELNNEQLIQENPELYKTLFQNLNTPIDLEDSNNEASNNNEVDCLVSLCTNDKTFNSCLDTVVDMNLLNSIFELHKDDEKIKLCQNTIEKIKEKVSHEEQAAKNKKEVTDLCEHIDGLYKQNIAQVEEMQRKGILKEGENFMRTSCIRVSRLSREFNSISSPNTPLFPVFGDDDPKNSDYKSDLSVKNNKNLNNYIEKILVKINSLFNEIKKEYEDGVNQKKEANEILASEFLREKMFLIKDLFKALKKLCLHPENHKTILELGLNDLLEKFSKDKSSDLKFYLSIDALQAGKLCTTSPNAISSFTKAIASHLIIEDMMKTYNELETLLHNDILKKIFVLQNSIFMNICKTKEGFDFVYKKIGLRKLLEISKRTHSPEVLATIQETVLNFIKSGSMDIIGELINEISSFNLKCAKLHKKSSKMLTNSLLIAGLLVGNEKMLIGDSDNSQNNELKEEIKKLENQGNESEKDTSGNLTDTTDSENEYLNLPRKSIKYNSLIINIQNSLVGQSAKDFSIITSNTEYFNSLLFFLGKLSNESTSANIEIEKTKLIDMITDKFCRNDINSPESDQMKEIQEYKAEMTDPDEKRDRNNSIKYNMNQEDLFSNEAICENYTNLIYNLLSYNPSNIKKFCTNKILDQILEILQQYKDSENQQIILNCLVCLEILTTKEESVKALSQHKCGFSSLMTSVITEKEKDSEVTKYTLKSLCNYFKKDIGLNYKKLNLEELIQLLIDTQKRYYAFWEILNFINILSGNLIENTNEPDAKEKLIKIILNSINIQESNINLVPPTLDLILNITNNKNNYSLIEELVENNLTCIIQVLSNLKSHCGSCILSCKILSNCIGNPVNSVYCYSMTNFGLLASLDKVLDYYAPVYSNEKIILEKEIYDLLAKLAKDDKSSEKIAFTLMKYIIGGFSDLENPNNESLRKLVIVITKNKKSIEPFVQSNGIQAVFKNLNATKLTPSVIFDNFKIINNTIETNDDYKVEMMTIGMCDVVNSLIPIYSLQDKKIEFEGKTIIFSINQITLKLEEIKKIDTVEVKMESSLKQEIKNFITNGKIIKM